MQSPAWTYQRKILGILWCVRSCQFTQQIYGMSCADDGRSRATAAPGNANCLETDNLPEYGLHLLAVRIVFQTSAEQQEIRADIVAPSVACKVPGNQSSPSSLELCDFPRQWTGMSPILISGGIGNVNSAACGHIERRYESRFPQGIPQQALVVSLHAIHSATFLRGYYDWNSPNWRPLQLVAGQWPEMWQVPLEMSGFLQAQTRTFRL